MSFQFDRSRARVHAIIAALSLAGGLALGAERRARRISS